MGNRLTFLGLVRKNLCRKISRCVETSVNYYNSRIFLKLCNRKTKEKIRKEKSEKQKRKEEDIRIKEEIEQAKENPKLYTLTKTNEFNKYLQGKILTPKINSRGVWFHEDPEYIGVSIMWKSDTYIGVPKGSVIELENSQKWENFEIWEEVLVNGKKWNYLNK